MAQAPGLFHNGLIPAFEPALPERLWEPPARPKCRGPNRNGLLPWKVRFLLGDKEAITLFKITSGLTTPGRGAHSNLGPALWPVLREQRQLAGCRPASAAAFSNPQLRPAPAAGPRTRRGAGGTWPAALAASQPVGEGPVFLRHQEILSANARPDPSDSLHNV